MKGTVTKRQTLTHERHAMVQRQIVRRGVRDELVLEAVRTVPREDFLPADMREFAYEDAPLPIEEGQTISQPFIVALMSEALLLKGGEKVLEIGTGSGYAAAVLAQIAAEVYTVERYSQLASKAAALAHGGFDNVHVLHGDGTLGWPDHAPYDGIVVAAGGPRVPEALKSQLKIGGRLVIPVGASRELQELVRVTRVAEHDYQVEELLDVRFVSLVGADGWAPDRADDAPLPPKKARPSSKGEDGALASSIASVCEKFTSIESADLAPLLQRIGGARVVLIGEATHGTSEFYRMRARITRELIERQGFKFVAIEGDWPDAARVDHYVRHAEVAPSEWTAFARFPAWMWRNEETREFVDWLRNRNSALEPERRAAFHGLDLYSLYSSIRSVLGYLDVVDPQSAKVARLRYGCLTPWQSDPATYGHAALTGRYRSCEDAVIAVLKDLRRKEHAYAEHDGERFLDAAQNALLVTNAEEYYRTMYYGSRASWNLRDQHMFDTLVNLLTHYGPSSKGIVWAHNSHVGDAGATEMSKRGEHNIGQLCKQRFGTGAYSIGFGTDSGTVAAATDWDGPVLIKNVRPAIGGSYERLCHESGEPRFLLPLRGVTSTAVQGLMKSRLERAIGVIYRPDTERESHYFEAVLPLQFDEYIWFDTTSAVAPLGSEQLKGLPDTYPFGI